MEFKEKLKEIMDQRGMVQQELAEVSGLPQATISHFLNGRRKPSFDNIKRLSEALNVSADYLLGTSTKLQSSSSPELNVLFRNLKGMSPKDIEKLTEISKIIGKKD